MHSSLVDTHWMVENMDDPGVCLIEIDWDGLVAYQEGHIPGALGWHWKTMLWDPLERQFPDENLFAERLAAAGISNETTVVFYGQPVQFGTYAWWVFKYLGHEDVRILDGGAVKWRQEGRPMERNAPQITRSTYVPKQANPHIRAGRRDVMRAVEEGNVCLLDHRSGEEFSGARVGLPGKPDVGAERYGRIPGARHVPFDSLLHQDTTFRSESEIREILSAHAPAVDTPIISYCRLSHRATLASFAMTEILGYTDVRVYDGSWTEWGSLVGVPIER